MSRLPTLATGLVLLGTWELSCRLGWVSPVLLRSPSDAFAAGIQLARSGMLFADLAFTLKVYLTALGASLVGGTVFGVALGSSPALDRAVGPWVVVANALPKIVLLPLMGLWVGVGFRTNVALGTLMGTFPVLVTVAASVRNLHGEWTGLRQAFGLSQLLFVRRVLLPGLLPALLAGARVAATYTMVGALLGEFFAGSEGLGFRMNTAMANFRVDVFVATAAVACAITVASTSALEALRLYLERRWSA